MTNFLSPLDPTFFLHHANLDRLWDVWTRKQKRLNLPYLPTGSDLDALSKEPFLFYVVLALGIRSGAEAGTYTVPVPPSAISNNRLSLRLVLKNPRSEKRAPTTKEVKAIRLKITAPAR